SRDARFQLIIALARAGEGHADPGEAGALQMLQLAPGDNPKAFDVPANEVEQLLARICCYGIIERQAVWHRRLQRRDLAADDIIVIDEQGGAARFIDKLFDGPAADHQLAVIGGREIRRNRTRWLHSAPPAEPLFGRYGFVLLRGEIFFGVER